MAARWNGSSDSLVATTNIPSASAFTMMAWIKVISGLSGYKTFFLLGNDSDGSANWCGTNGTQLTLYNSGGEMNGTALSTGVWYHIAQSVQGTASTDWKAWLNATEDISNTYSNNNARMEWGNDSISEWHDCRMVAIKVWDRALSASEIAAERRSVMPVSLQSLNRWVPLIDSETREYAHARNLTEEGTITLEADFPAELQWGPRTGLVIGVPAAAAPSALSINVSDTVSVTESQDVDIAPLAINQSDAVSVAESQDIDIAPLGVHGTDAVSVTESQDIDIAPLGVHGTDAVSVTEDVTVSLPTVTDLQPSVSDAVSVAESQDVDIAPLGVHGTDTVTVTEDQTVTIAGAADLSPSVSDTVSVAESQDIDIAPLGVHGTDTVTIGESVRVSIELIVSTTDDISVAEAATVTVNAAANLQPSVSDAVSVADAATVAISPQLISVSDVVTVTESATFAATPELVTTTDAVTVADAVTMSIASRFPAMLAARNVALTSARRNISLVSARRNHPVAE